MNSYIVATTKPWNIAMFHKKIRRYPGAWYLISDPKRLTPRLIKKIKPRYIFFPHWSWIVPERILQLAECVCFHETNLPYGRGGSPIQNLIWRGHHRTMISAIRMEKGLDTGPVYLKKPARLDGSAQEIFQRNAAIVAGMIYTMIKHPIVPKPQKGNKVVFQRRTPAESNIAALSDPSPKSIYDFIRMLDAPTYPKVFFEIGNIRFEFTQAKRVARGVVARVMITKQ